ncbi:hypothetical protein EBMC1_10579 [Sphingopyxis sp. MC1]|nr:hypothetical protein EBMC1_10579 [Sphingopyxis sp. MC1]
MLIAPKKQKADTSGVLIDPIYGQSFQCLHGSARKHGMPNPPPVTVFNSAYAASQVQLYNALRSVLFEGFLRNNIVGTRHSVFLSDLGSLRRAD